MCDPLGYWSIHALQVGELDKVFLRPEGFLMIITTPVSSGSFLRKVGARAKMP
jgi:hypothetical protein